MIIMFDTQELLMADVRLGLPRFEESPALLVAGLQQAYTSDTRHLIPLQWQRFAPQIGRVPGQVGNVAYGACFRGEGGRGIRYMTCVQVSSADGLPNDWTTATLPAGRYAVFVHNGHVSELGATLEAIHEWLPDSGLKVACNGEDSVCFFERYGEEFCPDTGRGGMEVWVPLEE